MAGAPKRSLLAWSLSVIGFVLLFGGIGALLALPKLPGNAGFLSYLGAIAAAFGGIACIIIANGIQESPPPVT